MLTAKRPGQSTTPRLLTPHFPLTLAHEAPVCCYCRYSMATPSISDSDPFSDSIEHVLEHGPVAESVLVVGRDASLTLATDSLIVLGTHLALLLP